MLRLHVVAPLKFDLVSPSVLEENRLRLFLLFLFLFFGDFHLLVAVCLRFFLSLSFLSGKSLLLLDSELDFSHLQQLWVLLHKLLVCSKSPLLVASHSVLVEGTLSSLSDLLDSRHGLQRRLDQLSVVSDRNVSALGERQRRVDSQLLAGSLPERLRPLELSWVSSLLEVLVALGPAELELLGVVTHKGYSVARVHGRRAEVAAVDSHCVVCVMFFLVFLLSLSSCSSFLSVPCLAGSKREKFKI